MAMDSTAMTIDFLRARLLSERSISRTARQRADELAKRVVELKEQLKLVTHQRKKAEKATSEVLAILENNGITDVSEEYDSNSDQEGPSSKPKEVEITEKEQVSLTTSRPMKVKVDEPSGLGLEVFPAIGRSLSWKSSNDSPNYLENAKFVDETRRRNDFISTGGSSTRHHLGKSCRRIKQKERRSSEVEVNDKSLIYDAQENAVAIRSGDASPCITDIPKILKEDHENEEDKVYVGNLVQGSLEDQRKEANHVFVEGSGRNAEMERALEHQARLIDQFEAEENAQREWEEKFKGNNCHSPDSYEHGNQSDITEERDEVRAETSEAVDTISSQQRAKSGSEQVAVIKDLPNRFQPHPHHENGYSQEQVYRSPKLDQSQNTFPEFSFPGQENLEAKSNEKWKAEWSGNNSFCSASYESSDNQAAQFSSYRVNGSFSKAESSVNALQVAAHHDTPNGLGGVLDALQRAKLSLNHELNRLSSSTGGGPMLRTKESPASAITVGEAMDIPVGCAGLFRVPTGSQFEALAKPSSLAHYPDSDSSLARYYPGPRVGAHADDGYTSSLDRSSVNSTHRPIIDPYMDKGMSLPSTRLMYPSYVDLMPRMSSNDEFSRNYSSMGLGMAGKDRHSEYSDRV